FAVQAKALGVDPREATVARGEALQGVGREPQLEESIFALAIGGVSAPTKTRTGYVIAKVVEQIPAGVPPRAEVKAQAVEAIKRERAESQAMERAKQFVTSLSKGGEFAATAKAEGLTTGELPWFSRAEPPKERGKLPGGVMVAALQTAAGQVAEPVRAGMAVYVVKTLERQPADPQGFDAQRADLEKQILEQKRREVWDTWVRAHRATMKVEIAGAPTNRY